MNRACVPLAIRTTIDLDVLLTGDPCDATYVLGSFWPYSRTSFESRVVKGFKECVPTSGFEPHISALAKFYANQVLRFVQNDYKVGWRFDWVVRVLASTETKPDRNRPLALLADLLCRTTGARDATHLLFKTESRPPMRVVNHLSGPDALKSRVRYVVQDLFIRPANLGGMALLIDDIANTGASMRVYAQALKFHAGVERVIGINLAATRFAQGKDGRGMLVLDTSELESHPTLCRVLVDSSDVFHLSDKCPLVHLPVSCELRFLAERKFSPCPTCCGEVKSKSWWRRL